jgi:uncharacterized membrane protein YuzA (DUF378 family)
MPTYKKVFVVLQLVIWFAVLWPGYAWFGSEATPLVFGIPFSFFWIILWVLIGFAGIYALYFFDYSTSNTQQITVDPEGLFTSSESQQQEKSTS